MTIVVESNQSSPICGKGLNRLSRKGPIFSEMSNSGARLPLKFDVALRRGLQGSVTSEPVFLIRNRNCG